MKSFHKTYRHAEMHQSEKSEGKTHFVVIMVFICLLFVPIIIKLFFSQAGVGNIQLPNELGLSTIAALSSTWLLHYADQDDVAMIRLMKPLQTDKFLPVLIVF